jgi:hypothetical protein
VHAIGNDLGMICVNLGTKWMIYGKLEQNGRKLYRREKKIEQKK